MEGTRGVTDVQMEGRGLSASIQIRLLALPSRETAFVADFPET